MLELVDLFEFEVIVAPELGVASSHRVGGFQQVVAEVAVAGFNHSGMLCLEVTGLVSVPDKASIFGDRGLGFKAAYIPDFSDDTGGVDLANAGNGCQRVRDDFKLVFNGLVQNLDLFLQSPHGGNGDRHGLVYRIVHSLGQAVRASGRSPYRLGGGCRVGKSAPACFSDKGGQFFHVSVCQVIHGFKVFHERDGGGAGVLDILGLGYAGAFQK